MSAASAARLRLVTWNIRALRDDRQAVIRTLRRLEPDVVCLQETPRFLRWRARLAALAREAGLVYACGGRTTGSSAILTNLRVDVRQTWEVRFSRTPGLHQRGVAIAVIRPPGGTEVAVGSTHLGLNAEERQRHLAELEAAMRDAAASYAIVAGDLNEKPTMPVWRALAGRRRDCGAGDPRGTFPARAPRSRIDGVFVDTGIDMVSYEVVDDADARAGSDHLPVLVELRVSAEAPAQPSERR